LYTLHDTLVRLFYKQPDAAQHRIQHEITRSSTADSNAL
jgi:hypothetical protein